MSQEPNILFKPYSFQERDLNGGSKFQFRNEKRKIYVYFVRTCEELASKKKKRSKHFLT